jgi:hypothetical protein
MKIHAADRSTAIESAFALNRFRVFLMFCLLAFVSGCGKKQTVPVPEIAAPVFSPARHGEMVVMVGVENTGWQYRTLDLATGALGRIIFSSMDGLVTGYFNNDGTGLTGFSTPDTVDSLHTMIVRMVDLATGKARITGVGAFMSDQPVFSPDGKFIAMHRADRPDAPSSLAIWELATDSLKVYPLTGQSIIEPHWLNDNTGIVVLGISPAGVGIFLFDTAGKTWKILHKPDKDLSAGRLAMHPDGERFAFCGRTGTLNGLLSFNMRSGNISKIAGIDVRECVYSPTGDTLAVIVNTEKGERLGLLTPVDTIPKIIQTNEKVYWPNWICVKENAKSGNTR